MKLFAWIVCINSLLIAVVLNSRKIHVDPRRRLCVVVVKTIIHCVRDCNVASQV